MKKRDYSNPHTWQGEEKPILKSERRNIRPFLVVGLVVIIAAGFFSYSHQHQSLHHHNLAKNTGPVIKPVTLPLHQHA